MKARKGKKTNKNNVLSTGKLKCKDSADLLLQVLNKVSNELKQPKMI